MNELTISKQVPASITFDKDKTIAEVRANLTAYYDDKGVFIPLDEDKLAESKKERAALVKVAKAFNDKKIAVKKELSAEIAQFESDVKEVIQVVKDVQEEFDTQIKATEEHINVARQNEIMSWTEYKCISDYVSFNDDWLKKSWKDDKKLKAELNNINGDIERAISSIKMFATSHDLDSDKYLEMFKSQPLDTVQQRIIEDSLLVKQIKGETVIETNVMDTTAPITTITRNLTGSIQQLKMLQEYCDKINVKWER